MSKHYIGASAWRPRFFMFCEYYRIASALKLDITEKVLASLPKVRGCMTLDALHAALRVELSKKTFSGPLCDYFWLKITVEEIVDMVSILNDVLVPFTDSEWELRGRTTYLQRTTRLMFLIVDGKLVQYTSTEVPEGWHVHLWKDRFCAGHGELPRPAGVRIV